ncbi:type I polyketide synthase [Streptomyces celluloflavus]|uniref:type I polyketide synthase n=1 Tax=Streptomyces celluloflavus TaxID=58344 RepID=UPI0036B878DA
MDAVVSALARMWVAGVGVEWGSLLAGQRVELPTYAFQRKRYWPQATTSAHAPALDAESRWRYRIAWSPLAEPGPARLSGTWLLSGESAEVAAALTERGAEVVTLDPARRERAALADALPRDLSGVVSVLPPDETPQDLADLLTLAQALGDAGIEAPLWVLTSGAVATTPGEPLPHPMQAQAWGLGRVFGLEFPERWGGLVDLPPDLDARAADHLVAVLAGLGEDQVAVRPSGLAVRRLERAPEPSGTATWAPRGSVLVTGGTGALARHVTRWLTGRGAPHLVLTSRTGPSAAGVAAAAAELAGRGTAVDVLACDIAERPQIAAVLGRTPELCGVVHTAGVGQSTPAAETTPAEQAEVGRAKLLGARWLDELTADRELDVFVVFSSIAATWGSAGQSGYAAANAGADALVEDRRARGLAGTSVAWGLWGGEAGLGAGADGTQVQRHGVRPMDPAAAVRALARAVDAGDGALTVADIDWQLFAPTFTLRGPSPLLTGVPEAAAALRTEPEAAGGTRAGELADRLGKVNGPERSRQLVALMRSCTADVLGHASAADIPPERAFKDLGFDSLTSVELRDRVAAATGLVLPATLVFDHPTPAALAAELDRMLVGGDDAGAKAGARATAVAVPGRDEPIAIVGLGLRMPGGVETPEQLWDLLASGTDAVGSFPADRGWRVPAGNYAAVGGFLRDATEFDAAFFGISPREALAMDPQQRLLLEVCWEALERAGIDPSSLKGSRTGVFAGAAASGYGSGTVLAEPGASGGHLMTGASTSVLSGRVSYVLGLTGPAVTVDTACSSSLVALHLAVQSLRSGECTLALAGGVTVMSSPDVFAEFAKQQVLAGDGRCKAFAAGADGTGWAEGAGVIAVERLSDAQRLGHRVLAVVRGTAANQDGASNGLTAPNGPSQRRVIAAALENAQLAAADVDAVEAHGTGTELGDPIEAQALLATYGQAPGRTADQPLWLGSVKSNIGHSQQAAGIAGVLKMVLALQHGMLPRTLHAQTPSPHVDWSAGHVKLLQEPTLWTGDGERVRRAGVSAFGISGTNVHVIVEEAPPETAPPLPGAAPSAVLDGAAALAWPVSGYDSAGRAAQAGRLREHVLARPEVAPDEVALSLAATRTAFEYRAVVLGVGREELTAGLAAVATGRPAGNAVTGSVVPSSAGRTVFVFPGQGSQWVGMGRELAEVSPVFAARLAECAAALEPYVDWELEDVLAGRHGFEAADVVQPALWAVMVSLAAVWQAAGVQPDAVVGHSQGEIAAAAVAGILSLDDAAKVVALRSKTLTALAGRGGMMAVEQTADTVRGWLAPYGDRLAVAAVNGATATVVSGEPQALRALADEHADTRTRILPVDYASHSAHVDELREEILTVLAGIAPREAGTPMISAMSGDWLSGTGTGPEYWYASLRETVEFARAVHTLGEQGHTTFLEVSPHPVLTGAIADSLEERSPVVVGTLRREDGGAERLLAGFAEAYVNGVPVDWTAVLGGTGRGPATELPTYAFQRERFWPEPAPEPDASAGNTPAEAGFWSAVESGDRTVLAKLLGVDPDDAALGALTSWRRRERADSAVADWRYRISWAPLAVPASARLTGGWLLVGEAPEVAEPLAAHGARVCTVDIAGMDGTDRAALAAALPAGIEDLAGIVFAPDLGAAGADDAVPGGLAATLSLVQALGDAGLGAPLWVLTRGAVEAVPGEAVNDPTGAQIWALGRSVALEHPERWGGLIDLPADGDERTGARLAALLADGTEDQVALRGSGAYGRRLVRAPQPSTGDDTADWTPHGSVLVTGGTGAIGGHLARWLAERGAPRAVLTSRSGPSAAGAAALAADLAGAGTAVHVLACDLSERAAVAGLLDRIDATGPALSAVLHAAGVGSGGSVDELTAADLAEVSGAKVAGARWLDELMADRALDAFVLFSSGAAVWGGSGQPGYAAANGYLDGLAARRRAAGRPAIAVSWGLWGGGGLGAGAAGAQLSRIGVREMDPARALRALGRILGQGQDLDASAGDAAVTVADIDWEIFAPAFTLRRPSPLLAALPEAARALAASDGTAAAADGVPDSAEGGVTLAERLAGRPRAEQLRRLVEVVRGEAAAVLGHAGAGALPQTRPFRKLGFDSVMAIDLCNRVAAASGLRLPATLVFDHPTPAELAEYLHGELGLGSGGAEAEGDGAEGGADPVLAGLDRLEAALAAVPGGSGARRDVTTRLRAVLSRWLGDGGDAQQQQEQQNKQQTVTGRLEDASAGEVLDFINQELGLS